MKTIEWAMSYGISLQNARLLTDEEKMHYIPEVQECMLVGLGNYVNLPHVHFADIEYLTNRSQYFFSGCNNIAYEITDAEWDAFVRLNSQRAEKKKVKEKEERIKSLEQLIEKAELQRDIPSRKEIQRRLELYNSVNNEGGEGWLPRIISREEYESAKAILEKLRNE